MKAASQVTPVVVQYPVNPGPGFDAFVDVLLMKMYRFKGDTGVREEQMCIRDSMKAGRRRFPLRGETGSGKPPDECGSPGGFCRLSPEHN